MRPDTDSPSQAWWVRAQSDLAIARQPKPEQVLFEDLCFHAQQAVEKSIKAVLAHHNVSFPRIHDIYELGNLAVTNTIPLPDDFRKAVRLSGYAAQSRYPGDYEPVTEGEWREAVRLATVFVSWASESLT